MNESAFKRSDARSLFELRPFKVDLDIMGFAASSLTISTGKTSVLCSLSIEEGVPLWRKGSGKGWLTAEYRLLPGSTPVRQKRELVNLSGRTQEIQRLISRTLRATIDMDKLGERTILIDCDVIQADAGTRTASITGAWIALFRGCESLVKDGLLKENPVKTQVAAVSVGIVNGFCLLDLDYSEDSKADVDLNVVLDESGNFLEIQGTAENKPFSKEQLNQLLEIAHRGIKDLQSAQLMVLNRG